MADALEFGYYSEIGILIEFIENDNVGNFTLDVVDFLTGNEFISNGQHLIAARSLDEILSESGSAWKVHWQSDTPRGLIRRVDLWLQAQAEAIFDRETRTSSYLATAWPAAYGRNPNPSAAYSDAIRAIEAAAIPIISPNDSKATLGKMIGEIKRNPDRFSTRLTPEGGLNGVAAFIGMLDLVWKAQLGRHGTPDDTVPLAVSQEEAEDALALAVSIVQWLQSGAFYRK